MPAQRIKGQEVSILIVRDGALEAELVDIQNFNFEPDVEIKTQGYLGEKSNRTDDIYNGVKGDLELNLHDQDWFTFLQAVQDRAKRNTPDVKFNITAVLAFPNGQTPSVIIPDVKFGSFPHNVASRGDYVKVKISYAADDYTLQPS